MEPSYRIRLYLLTAIVLVGFGTLLSRLHEFQIERRDDFLQLVPGNRNVTVREPGIRGEIIDRNGITLARNLRNYEASFNLEEIRQAYLSQHTADPTLHSLVRENGMPRKRSDKDIAAIVKEGPLSILQNPRLNLAKPIKGDLRSHFLTHGGLIPFSYRSDLTYDEFAKFAEHNLELPGVYLNLRPQRSYPYGALGSHVLGYLKQWEKGDVPDSATRKFNHYIGDDKGIAGIEASMDDILRGPEGQKTIVKDEKGRAIGMSDYIKPGTGSQVRLTIDAPVQHLLETTLRMAGRAAGVIMDVNSGEILAMASVPDYNPNDFIPSISRENWNAYRSNKQLAPLTNRAISGFAPGSTMKIATAVAGGLHGMGNRTFSCDGFVMYGNRPVGCWIWNMHRGMHGGQSMSQAIKNSCNPYFNKLANAIGPNAMVEGCQLVNIGKKTGIELPKEESGILPGSPAWKRSNPSAFMTPALSAMFSIGQGDAMATPIQVCAMAATIANGGKYYKPRIVKEAIAENGKIVIEDLPKLEVDLTQSGIKASDIELIRRGMWMSVNEGGTSSKVKLPTIEAAAKSGTAQTSDDGKPSHNSWITSFAPYENPKYAICVLVQNGYSGGGVCGPLVNLIYRGLFARDAGVRLPLKPLDRFTGNTDRIDKPIEISPEMIATIEAGDTTPAPSAIAAAAAESTDPNAEVSGERGDEVGGADPSSPTAPPPLSNTVIPTPTITPELDADGAIIPKAVPIKDP
jgi:penicillin-binding protein 2